MFLIRAEAVSCGLCDCAAECMKPRHGARACLRGDDSQLMEAAPLCRHDLQNVMQTPRLLTSVIDVTSLAPKDA